MVAALVSVPVVQLVWHFREAQSSTPAQARDTGASTEVHEGSDGAGGSWLRSLRRANRHLKSDIDAYEEDLEDQSVVAQFLRPPSQQVLSGVLGAGNEKVYCGLGGWLFYRPSIDYLTGPGFLSTRHRERRWEEPIRPDPLRAILRFHDQLIDRGIRLVILPVPVKGSIHPEKFARGFHQGSEAVQNPSYHAFLRALGDHGVTVFALDSLLAQQRRAGREVFLKTDTHWRPEMVGLTAQVLAAFLRDRGIVSAPDAIPYSTTRDSVSGTGDLAAMLQLPRAQRVYPAEEVIIEPVVGPTGDRWRPLRDSEVLLLGDSYANIYSQEALGWGGAAGLGAQLSHSLQQPVDCILRNDHGAFATRQMLRDELARGRDRLAGKRVVIYQFSARELAVGDWRLIDLPSASGMVRRLFCPPSGQLVPVTGTVTALSDVPRPYSVPYRDHIFTIDLENVRSMDRTEPLGRAAVYLWSMRDNELTDAARLSAGQQVAIVVRPWSDVADSLDGFNRSELDELVLDPCWGELLD